MRNRDFQEFVEDGRRMLRANWERFEGRTTDQDLGMPVPEQDKPVPDGAVTIALPAAASLRLGAMPLEEAIRIRRSRRKFTSDPLSLEELSFLLWATQGVAKSTPQRSLRTAPSGGARHSLDTYLHLARVTGASPGIWRYRPFDHAIVLLSTGTDLAARMHTALMGQSFGSAVVFVWATVAYRTEWRYAPVAHKVIALDAGHVCQNLYLSCESIGCGTCAIGAYDQVAMDALLGLDGNEEFAVYAAPVGRKP